MNDLDLLRFIRRSRPGALVLVVALLAPAAWMQAICADEWAHATSPTDNPDTPGPDLYNCTRLDDGAWSVAKRLAIQATCVGTVLESPLEKFSLTLQNSDLFGRMAADAFLCRGPPVFSAS